MFEAPTYDFSSVLFTGLGVILLWSKMGRKGIRPYALSNLIELFSLSKRATTILEFLVFLALGVAAGIAIVQPVNAPQAIAAGLGWTGLFTRDV